MDGTLHANIVVPFKYLLNQRGNLVCIVALTFLTKLSGSRGQFLVSDNLTKTPFASSSSPTGRNQSKSQGTFYRCPEFHCITFIMSDSPVDIMNTRRFGRLRTRVKFPPPSCGASRQDVECMAKFKIFEARRQRRQNSKNLFHIFLFSTHLKQIVVT